MEGVVGGGARWWMRRAVVEVKRRERGVGGIEEGELEGGGGDGGCDGGTGRVFERGGEVEVGGGYLLRCSGVSDGHWRFERLERRWRLQGRIIGPLG